MQFRSAKVGSIKRGELSNGELLTKFTELQLGVPEAQRTFNEFSMFFNMEELFNNAHNYDAVEFNPVCLKFQICEVAELLKSRLSCLIRAGNYLNNLHTIYLYMHKEARHHPFTTFL